MTSKKLAEYERTQLKNFDKFIQKCLEQKVDTVFIAGNLFGTSKPKNRTIEKVIRGFNRLSEQGITVFILPGSHDTPLTFSDDQSVHFIFENLENIIFLHFSKDQIKGKKVSDYLFKGKIKNVPLQIFAPPAPLTRPDNLEFNLQIDKDYINLFIISDIFSFKKETEKIFNDFLDNLDGSNINFLLLGGVIPDFVKLSAHKYQILPCPQFHQNNFNYYDGPNGILIYTFTKGQPDTSNKIISISDFKITQETVDVGQIPIVNLNDEIKNVIKNHSGIKNISKLVLMGKMNKDDYHQVEIYKFRLLGRRLNFYFELIDNIEFQDETPVIKGLNVISELEKTTQSKLEEIEERSDLTKAERKKEISIFEYAIKRIKKDWEK